RRYKTDAAGLLPVRQAGAALGRFLFWDRLCLRFGRRALRSGALRGGAARRLCPAIGGGFGTAADRAAAFALRLLRREQHDRGVEREIVRISAFRQRRDDAVMADIGAVPPAVDPDRAAFRVD